MDKKLQELDLEEIELNLDDMESTQQPESKIEAGLKPRKKRSALKIALIVLGVLVLLIAAAAAAIGWFVSDTMNKIQRTDAEQVEWVAPENETFETDEGVEVPAAEAEEATEVVEWNGIELLESQGVQNILLIGQDRREGQGRQRSDTMIICSINTNTGELTLTSVMRDLYVQIPGYSDNRINATYAFGGMELLDATIEKNFGIKIDGNVEVDFDGFIEALTIVGNLDIALTQAEADYINNAVGGGLQAGMNNMNQEQLLTYARIRYLDSDFYRTERQRKVVMAAFDKMKGSSLQELLTLVDQILPCVTTDMSNAEILSCVYTVVSNNMMEITSQRIPIDGSYRSTRIRGMSVLVPDLAVNNAYLKETIYHE